MAQDQIKRGEIIQEGLFNETSKSAQELKTILDALKISFANVSKETGKIFNANKNMGSAKEVNELTKALEKQETIRKTTQKAIERERLAEIRLAQQREKAFDNYEKQLQKERITLEKNRKQLAKNNSEYNKLTKQLGLVRGRAKDVAAEMFNMERSGNTTGVEYVRLQKRLENLTRQTNVLDTGIKNIDKSLGLHQREVGNYAIATEQLSPHLRMIDMQLRTMGTSLTEISGEGGFKALTNSLKNFGRSAITFLMSPIGLVLTTLGGLFMLIKSNKQTVLDFNSGLLNVGKTTGLAGGELEQLGDDLVQLSRDLKTVGVPALLEYATVAGQLGVKGSENILLFAESLAKLETASDISGEEGAAQIARLLTLTDGGVENIAQFGDEIVNLGNNFAATEAEILGNATAIAQNTGVYKLGRKEVLAYATATKAVGLESELTGSTIGRTLAIFEKAIRTGENLNIVTKLTGKSQSELNKQFKENSGQVLTDFIGGLNKVAQAGGSVNEQLEKVGIIAVRDQRVIGSLATAGYDTLSKSIDTVNKASGALNAEFETASSKLENQLSRVSIAWDNLILSIENGQGVLGKIAVFFAGELADAIETTNKLVDNLSGLANKLGSSLDFVNPKILDWIKTMVRVPFDLLNPVKWLEKLNNVFDLTGKAIEKTNKETRIFMTILQRSQIDLNKSETVNKKRRRLLADINAELDIQNKLLSEGNFATRSEAKVIQDRINKLEAERNAILGIVEAKKKEKVEKVKEVDPDEQLKKDLERVRNINEAEIFENERKLEMISNKESQEYIDLQKKIRQLKIDAINDELVFNSLMIGISDDERLRREKELLLERERLNQTSFEKTEKKKIEIEKDYQKQITSNLKVALDERDKLRQRAFELEQQERDRQTQIQSDRAAAGLKNTLAFQEAESKKAALVRKQELEKEQRRREALALSEMFLNSVSSNTKAGQPTGLAVSNALATTFAAKGIAKGLQFFNEGTEFVEQKGKKSIFSKGKDTVPAMLAVGEGVVKADANMENRGVVAALNKGVFQDLYAPRKAVESSANNFNASILLHEQIKTNQLLEKIASKPNQWISQDVLGQIVEKTYHKSHTDTTVYKRSINPFKR